MSPPSGSETPYPAPLVRPRSGILWGWVGLAFLAAGLLALALYRWFFPEPRRRLAGAMVQWVGLLESGPGTNAVTLSGRLRIVEAHGRWRPWQGAELHLMFQPPDRIRLEGRGPGGLRLLWIRNGNHLEVHDLERGHGFVGRPTEAHAPGATTDTLEPIRSPVAPGKVWMAVLTLDVQELPETTAHPPHEYALRVRPRPRVIRSGVLPPGELRLWLREADGLPHKVEIRSSEESPLIVLVCDDWRIERATAADAWHFQPPPAHRVEQVPIRALAEYWNQWWDRSRSSAREIRPPDESGTRGKDHAASHGSERTHPDDPLLTVQGTAPQRARALGKPSSGQAGRTLRRLVYGWGLHRSLLEGQWRIPLAAAPRAATGTPSEAEGLYQALASPAGLEEPEVRAAHRLAATLPFRYWTAHVRRGTRLVWCLGLSGSDADGFLAAEQLRWLVHQPGSGLAWTTPVWPGLWSGRLLLNECQLALLWLDGPADPDCAGWFPILLGNLMEQCASAEAAVERLKEAGWAVGCRFVLVDGHNDRAVELVRRDAGIEPRPLVPGPPSRPEAISSDGGFPGDASIAAPEAPDPLPEFEALVSRRPPGTAGAGLSWNACVIPATGETWLARWSGEGRRSDPEIFRWNALLHLRPGAGASDPRTTADRVHGSTGKESAR
ncbi:MAG: hypothetical protein KatS3mg132_179 [Limisphaera sp.]|nr:MAG: hypothetical protein KatS3mg132_179 [Limisphaera sp.]